MEGYLAKHRTSNGDLDSNITTNDDRQFNNQQNGNCNTYDNMR